MFRWVFLLSLLLTGCHRMHGDALHQSDPRRVTATAPSWHSWYQLPAGERAAAYAQSLYGRDYCWGGTGPSCYDCSGLTQMAWRWAGKQIPRVSRMQRRKLKRVPWQQVRPGDVLWRPGHVGMYVGHGWVIYAPGRGKRVQYQPANKYRSAHRPN